MAGFGIHVTLIEPGGFSTDWAGPSSVHSEQISAYDEVREARARFRGSQTPGDPAATRGPILKIVDAEQPPLRCFFGEAPRGIAPADYESRLAEWREWQPVSVEAQGTGR